MLWPKFGICPGWPINCVLPGESFNGNNFLIRIVVKLWTVDFIDTPLKDICKVDLDRTRSWLLSSAEARTIALGSVVSPAWYDRCSSNTSCFHCHAHVGDWKHIVWYCNQRPLLIRALTRPSPLGLVGSCWKMKI